MTSRSFEAACSHSGRLVAVAALAGRAAAQTAGVCEVSTSAAGVWRGWNLGADDGRASGRFEPRLERPVADRSDQ